MLFELLRHAVAMVHAAPGTGLTAELSDGTRAIVAHRRLDAMCDPCALRRALVSGMPPRWLTTAGSLRVSGLVHLGGGVHARVLEARHERWLTAAAPSDDVVATLRACPVAGDRVDGRVVADPELGISVVRITAPDGSTADLDAVAAWAAGALLALELVAVAAAAAPGPSPIPPTHGADPCPRPEPDC